MSSTLPVRRLPSSAHGAKRRSETENLVPGSKAEMMVLLDMNTNGAEMSVRYTQDGQAAPLALLVCLAGGESLRRHADFVHSLARISFIM